MSIQLQLRRGTTAQCDAFTGAQGEVAIDTTLSQIRVHDGTTAGGIKVARDSDKQDVSTIQSVISANTDVAANTADRHVHSNKSILDAITASFTTAEETLVNHFKGTYADATALDTAHPTGADGDYAIVQGSSASLYAWDTTSSSWITAGGISQTFADARYAAIGGSASQVFSVANAVGSSDAVALGQMASLIAANQASAITLAANGYINFANGFAIRWGSGQATPSGNVISFALGMTSCFAVVDVCNNQPNPPAAMVSGLSGSGFTATTSAVSPQVYYVAIGDA